MASNQITDVDPELIIQTAAALDTYVSQMNSIIKNVVASIEELKNTWSGEAAKAFMSQFEGDKALFNAHTAEYQKLNDALRQSGKAYQTSEEGVLSDISKLKI